MNSSPSFKEIDHRSHQPFEQEKLLTFLNQQLRPSVSFKLQDEYPSLFRKCPGGKSLFIVQDGNPVSHVAFTSRVYQHPLFQIKIGLIGSVATQEAYRGRGLATQLLDEACRRLRQEGCVLVILWSDQPDFYKPLGFYRAGLELDFCLSPQSVGSSGHGARPIDLKKDLDSILKLYQSHSGKIVRDLKEMEMLLQVPQARIFVSEESGRVDSYIAINKGLDFSLTIHEWGGCVESVMANVSYCQKNYFPSSPLNLIAPCLPENQLFSQIAHQWGFGSLGLIKILNSEEIVRIWKSYLRNVNLNVPRELDSSSSEENLLVNVFGREGANIEKALPFFLWGFDSI